MLRCKILSLIAVFSIMCSSISYGDLILDQACEEMGLIGYGVEKNIWGWQEFRPTMDDLEQVDLYLENLMVPSSVTVFFEVRDGATVLWDTSFSADLIVGMGWFEIDTPQISLVPDHTYRLYITSDLTYEQQQAGSYLFWSAVENDPYSRGISDAGSDIDFNFRTWAVPEPATVLFLGLGGLFLRMRKEFTPSFN